ncbi:hypothetical protein [Cucumibacter marinus]|uniref:hypothetical protein n=1 Tax=Cucumibacter marinus TaxID=1121252 RepID=UPI000421E1DE|nr:hypothetical protein [Cucumibacter marinus]
MPDTAVRRLFERYEKLMNQALGGGDVDPGEVASLYASEFIGAGPAGVMTGKNDQQFTKAVTDGYAYYRQIGTRAMRIRTVRTTPIDDLHCLAHVSWTAEYARADLPETRIDFEVHYLVQLPGNDARVFGWITGDEQEALKTHGII